MIGDKVVALPLLAIVLLGACEDPSYEEIAVRSAAFGEKEAIPSKHTCKGAGLSPPLTFSQMPEGTVSVAVIMDDPDRLSGTYTHWLLWGLPRRTTVPEDITLNLPANAVQGTADDGNTVGYLPPCPPAGKPHRFVFKAYALDMQLALDTSATRTSVDKEMAGHILGYGELEGVVTPK